LKIVHLCLSCFYIDGYSYQENMLVRQHVMDGHEVVVIASTENLGSDRKLTYVKPSVYAGTDGARVIRLPYRGWLPHVVMRKLRMHPGLARILESEKPDAVLFHGLSGFELLTAVRFKRRNANVRLYADSHEDARNSARNLPGYLLHRFYYRPIIRHSVSHLDKVLCISTESLRFVQSMYGLAAASLEFFPLGGVIPADDEYLDRRTRTRASFGLRESDVLFVQTGKMTPAKKLLQSLKAFSAVPAASHKLILAGSIDEDIRKEAEDGIAADARISFAGWMESEQLLDLLCAADVYLQPGTQSATMQMSLCARCPVILADVPSHHPYHDGNGWLLQSDAELTGVLREIAENPRQLASMSLNSLAISARMLDYRKLAARILQ
jgi:glycosyltransferase involved in cell wall biosynthesis